MVNTDLDQRIEWRNSLPESDRDELKRAGWRDIEACWIFVSYGHLRVPLGRFGMWVQKWRWPRTRVAAIMRLNWFFSEILENIHGYSVWFDKHLQGGQVWWDKILAEVRKCDVFVLVLSKESLRSKYCITEYKYAHALGKSILPIRIDKRVSVGEDLPRELAAIQCEDYFNGDDREQTTLYQAFRQIPRSKPLPDPLPPPPPPPSLTARVLFRKPP